MEPLELFAGLRSEGFRILLHSQTGEGTSYCVKPGRVITGSSELFDEARSGTWIALLAYDLGRRFERLPAPKPPVVEVPDVVLVEAEEMLAFDHATRACSSLRDAERRSDLLLPGGLLRPASGGARNDFRIGSWREMPDAEEYRLMVRRAQELIRAGDLYQVNLARWFSAAFEGDPFALFSALARKNPSPYAAFVDLPEIDLVMVSSSPELLFSIDGDRIATRPIAGTYPKSLPRDALPRDPKEKAEHIMLVDLERNDLGRVAEFGSVRVEELLAVEEYSHLYHIVSHVAAKLRPDSSLKDVIRALFPGGTITGTPKVRAMHVIDEFESRRRGLYTGSIGIFCPGWARFNIIIRTALIRSGRIHVAAGAGIVADSVPEREANETRIKAAAYLELSAVSL